MNRLITTLILTINLAFGGEAVIYSGNDVRTLKSNISINEVAKILTTSIDPSSVGLTAPVGSIALRSTGQVYYKTTAPDTGWELSLVSGAIDLTADVTGILPIANGGTGSANLGTGVVKASSGTLSSSLLTNSDISATASISYSKLATLTADRALVSDATGNVSAAVVTSTELGYLSGATSALQTQIDGKVTGPAAASDNAIVIYNGTTGKLVKNSLATIDGSGNITGTNLSGTNSGDQTITLTGDVTGSGTGSFATTIATGSVTNAMLAGSIDLTSKVTGTLPIANGGTGSATKNFVDLTTAQTIAGAKYFSDSVSIGAASPSSSAILQIDSTAKAFMPPRMTTAQKNAIATPVEGMVVYDTDLDILSNYDGSTWSVTSDPATRTVQYFVSGSGTYTTPAGVSYLRVRMVGGGGGGSGSGTSPTSGGNGGDSTFGTLTAGGGEGGKIDTTGGDGGTASGGDVNIVGGMGADRSSNLTSTFGGNGGNSYFGGGAKGGNNVPSPGKAAATNSGGGAGGAGCGATANAGSGGGGGGYVEKIISSPSATYSYAVGAAGLAGSAGTGGDTGGTGGSGLIIVEEYY